MARGMSGTDKNQYSKDKSEAKSQKGFYLRKTGFAGLLVTVLHVVNYPLHHLCRY